MIGNTLLENAQFIASIITAGCIILFLVQNSEDVQVAILLWTISMPRYLLLLLMLGIGFLAGCIVTRCRGKSHENSS